MYEHTQDVARSNPVQESIRSDEQPIYGDHIRMAAQAPVDDRGQAKTVEKGPYLPRSEGEDRIVDVDSPCAGSETSNDTTSEQDSRDLLELEDEETEADEDEDETMTEPLSSLLRPIACLRAPCLKKTSAVLTAVAVAGNGASSASESSLSSPTSSSLSSSPDAQAQHHSTATIPFSSFAAPRSLAAAVPKRQVHFDAAPPEAGLTHSGDRYDRRPIECTQGGSAFDLSLPPRGALAQYAESEASDDAGEVVGGDDGGDNEEREEASKGLAGRMARWSKLKNGRVIASSKSTDQGSSSMAHGATQPSSAGENDNACSVPVHGIRSFGGLAGRSGVAEEELTWSGRKSALRDDASNDVDEDDEYEARDEAFRRAVSAALLSKSPNATPMPSPRVRPRWECVASYFESDAQCQGTALPATAPTASSEETTTATEPTLAPSKSDGSIEGSLSPTQMDIEPTGTVSLSPSTSPPLVVTEKRNEVHGSACQSSANKAEDKPAKESHVKVGSLEPPLPQSKPEVEQVKDASLSSQESFSLLPNSPNTASMDGRSSFGSGVSGRSSSASNLSGSSPMSSRCSSNEAWSSSQSHLSTDDILVAAFSEAIMSRPSLSTDNLRLASLSPNASGSLCKIRQLPTSLSGVEAEGDLDADHERCATSSGSGSGGPEWLSSCCTSPELNPVDADDANPRVGEGVASSSLAAKARLLQLSQEGHLLSLNGAPSLVQPLRLQDREVLSDSSSGEIEQKQRSTIPSRPRFISKAASCPNSGHCSPSWVPSSDEHDSEHQGGDEEEAAAAASFFFRSSSGASKLARSGSRSKKTRRCASSSSSNGCESEDQVDNPVRRSPRPSVPPRSKSMSSAPSSASGSPRVRRTSQLSSLSMARSNSGQFTADEMEDEGALGGF